MFTATPPIFKLSLILIRACVLNLLSELQELSGNLGVDIHVCMYFWEEISTLLCLSLQEHIKYASQCQQHLEMLSPKLSPAF